MSVIGAKNRAEIYCWEENRVEDLTGATQTDHPHDPVAFVL